jgi:hypothetical protein
MSFNQSWSGDDRQEGFGKGVSSYNTALTLQTQWHRFFSTELSDTFLRQVSQMDTLALAGVLSHRLAGRAEFALGEKFDLFMSSGFDLRPFETDRFFKRMELIRIQGLFRPTQHRSFNVVATLHPLSGYFKTVDGGFSLNDPARRWQVAMNTSWVNNQIISRLDPDPNAPAFLDLQDPQLLANQFLVTVRANLALSEAWKVSLMERVNIGTKTVEEQAFSVWRDLHCWNLELFARERPEPLGWQFGFSLSLKALPEIKASSNQFAAETFSDAQFGY